MNPLRSKDRFTKISLAGVQKLQPAETRYHTDTVGIGIGIGIAIGFLPVSEKLKTDYR
jgi:hypothetical protein